MVQEQRLAQGSNDDSCAEMVRGYGVAHQAGARWVGYWMSLFGTVLPFPVTVILADAGFLIGSNRLGLALPGPLAKGNYAA